MAAKKPAPPAPRRPSGSSPPAARDAWRWAAPLLVGLAAFAAYANSLGNGFVWDDPIILSRQLVVFRSPADVLAPPRDIPQFSPDYYRPLTIASYLVDRAIGGDAPFVFHLSVVLAHALTSALLCALALQLMVPVGAAARAGALVAGLLFALHPIHTESVAWAAGRSDVLATGFILAALIAHGRPPWSWRGSALTGLCAAGALGAKETGIALYPLMLLRDVLCTDVLAAFGRQPARRPALPNTLARRDVSTSARQHVSTIDLGRAYSGVAFAGVVYILLRRNALGEMVGTAPQEGPVSRAPREVVAAFGVYLEKLVWPIGLNAYIDHIAGGPLPIAAAVLFIAGLGAVAWRWWKTRTNGVALFALAWIALTLMPSLAILWKIPDAPLAERYLYLPSAGFCLLLGDLTARAWSTSPVRVRPALVAVAGLLLALAANATVRHNPVWHDDIALWQDTEARSQVSGMAARSLGTAYQQAGRTAEARAAFEQALRRHNTRSGLQTLYNNLGTLAMYDRDYAAAQRHYEAALAANPGAADSIFNLGLAVLQAGGASPEAAQRALVHFQRALAINPHDADIEAGLGQAYSILGERAVARAHLQRALELAPTPPTEAGARELLRQLDQPS